VDVKFGVEGAAVPTTTIGHRIDIQILRAVAVLSVVIGHFWPDALPGGFTGVDVFFVISGFLITSLLVREVSRDSVVHLGQFWVRRVRRIFPAAIVVIIAVVVAVMVIGAPDQLTILSRHVIASSFSGENLVLGWDAVDYDHQGDSTSPLQHFWSLAVEEQFYLVWPILVAAIALLTRKRRSTFARVALVVVTVIGVTSLVYALVIGHHSPSNYFDPFARAWELAVGALIAIMTARRTNRRTPRQRLVLASWVVLAASFFVPGLTELTPGLGVVPAVLSTAAIIGLSSGLNSRPKFIPLRFAQRVGEWVGDRSYSLYLWHWPLVILAPLALESDLVDWQKFAAIAIAIALSDLSFRFIERPVRLLQARALRQPFLVLPVAGILSAALAIASIVVPTTTTEQPVVPVSASIMNYDPIATTTPDYSPQFPYVTPNCNGAAAAVFTCDRSEKVTVDESSVNLMAPTTSTCHYDTPKYVDDCVLGDVAGTTRIAFVGDSHARSLWKAMDIVGKRAGVQVHMFMHIACPYGKSLSTLCDGYNASIRSMLLKQHFDFILFAQRAYPDKQGTNFEQTRDAYKKSFRELVHAGKQIVVIKDNPLLTTRELRCVTQHFRDTSSCIVTRTSAFHTTDYAAESAIALGVPLIDLTDIYCDPMNCRTAIGGFRMFKDVHHLSNAFAATLAPFIWNDLRSFGFFAEAPINEVR
jgi:peptidoglycan/LPS O-acetylase OafA/YrhL